MLFPKKKKEKKAIYSLRATKPDFTCLKLPVETPKMSNVFKISNEDFQVKKTTSF